MQAGAGWNGVAHSGSLAGFLERNGFELIAAEADAVAHTLALAAGKLSETEYAAWLQANCKRPRDTE